MKVSEVMTANPVTVQSTDSLQAASRAMAENDCGSLPVIEDGMLCGVITDRDIAVRAVAEGCSPSEPVRTAMSADAVTVAHDTEVEEASRIMSEQQLRRLYVVEDDMLVGVVALGDLATQTVGPEAGEALEAISQ